MGRPTIAILASGEGTTAEAYIRASTQDVTIPAVSLVICNNKAAGIFKRVAALNNEYGLAIQTLHINTKTHPDEGAVTEHGAQSKAEQQAILDAVNATGVDLVVLMGYMKKVGLTLIRAFGWRQEYTSPLQSRMLNTHPGLLPVTKGFYGRGAQQQVLDTTQTEAGQTLHIVAEDYDEGPVVAEHRIKVLSDDTADTLFSRVQALEKANVPSDVAAFMAKRLNSTYVLQQN